MPLLWKYLLSLETTISASSTLRARPCTVCPLLLQCSLLLLTDRRLAICCTWDKLTWARLALPGPKKGFAYNLPHSVVQSVTGILGRPPRTLVGVPKGVSRSELPNQFPAEFKALLGQHRIPAEVPVAVAVAVAAQKCTRTLQSDASAPRILSNTAAVHSWF